MLRNHGLARWLSCALVLLATGMSLATTARCAADDQPEVALTAPPETVLPAPPDSAVAPAEAATGDTSNGEVVSTTPTEEGEGPLPEGVVRLDEPLGGEPLIGEYGDNDWSWQWAPTGLIYHSYMAGPHEPRMAIVPFSNLDGQVLADATLGGRAGFLRYGNNDAVNPQGYQLDFYGAAIARLDLKSKEDLVATDYVFGFPITWGDDQQQWKFGYSHLSSHLGDEFAISHPGALNNRINYVRDSLVLGTSYYVVPAWRLYGEVGYAFHVDGGGEKLAGQFGTELSQPGPTDGHLVPFVAVNARVRQDNNVCTDLTLQAGWLSRNVLGQTFRVGGQYYNGKSNQFEFFSENEQQVGAGIWYDF